MYSLKKKKSEMTCNMLHHDPRDGKLTTLYHFIIHFSKEIVLAAAQNMYEYCILCGHTVTYYVNAYCRKSHRSDLVRHSLSFSKAKQSHLCESLIIVRISDIFFKVFREQTEIIM